MDKFSLCFKNVLKIDQKTLRQKVAKENKQQIIFVNTNNPCNTPVFCNLMKYRNCLKIRKLGKFSNLFKNVEFIQSKKQTANLGDTLQHSYFGFGNI